MSSALKNLDGRIAALEAAAEAAREETRAAHEATKALRQAERDARAAAAEIRALLAVDLKELVDEALSEHVRTGLASYAESLRDATEAGHAHVIAEFEKLKNILLTGQEDGRGEHVFDAAHRTGDLRVAGWKERLR